MSASGRRLIITIDGPAGAGKSTAAKLLAQRLGYLFLDTGALYRAVAWKIKQASIDPNKEDALDALLSSMDLAMINDRGESKVLIDSKDVTPYLRTPEISRLASTVAALPIVRARLLPIQRKLGEQGGIVAEGRDMGTRVFPDADVKVFLDADVATRAQRRYHDDVGAGRSSDIEGVQQEIMARDSRDRMRSIAPLVPAPDAVIIDSTSLTVEQVVDRIMERVAAVR